LIIRNLHMLWSQALLIEPDLLASQEPVLVARSYIEDIGILIRSKLSLRVRHNALNKRLIQVDLSGIFRPVALEPEHLIQMRGKYEYTLIITQHDLRYILRLIGQGNPIVMRILIPDLHLILLRLLSRLQNHLP